MEDLSTKLTQLLNDPEGMKQLQSMAQELMGEGGLDLSALMPQQQEKHVMPDISGLMGGISPDQMGMMMKLMSAFNSTKEDDRTRLLMALRPHLTDKRQQRVDQAVKLLKLASVLPLISEIGIFRL